MFLIFLAAMDVGLWLLWSFLMFLIFFKKMFLVFFLCLPPMDVGLWLLVVFLNVFWIVPTISDWLYNYFWRF